MKKLIASLLFVPIMAHAEFFSGNDLLEKLQSADVLSRVQALGYIQGVADAAQNALSCVPNGVTAGQLNDMVKNYLQNVPANRNKSADSIIVYILRQTWPCANRQSNGRGA